MIKDQWTDKKECVCSDDRFSEKSSLIVHGYNIGNKYQYSEMIFSSDNHHQVNVYNSFDYFTFTKREFDKHFKSLSDIREEKLNQIL